MKPAIEYPSCNNPKVPAPVRPYRHRDELQIRFNDIDMVGHINNAVYLQFLDLGKSHYFREVIKHNVDWHHVPVVIVNINCSYYSPTYLDEPLEVLTLTFAISERSLKMEQRIINRDTGDVKCVATTVLAGFDPTTATGTTINPEWAAAIKDFEGLE